MDLKPFIERGAGRTASVLLDVPEPVLNTIFGEPPVNDRGARLDPQFHALLQFQDMLDLASVVDRSVEDARKGFSRMAPLIGIEPPGGVEVEKRSIDGPGGTLPVRIYHPPIEGELPGCVYFHGGGFVLGDLESYDSLCRFLSVHGGCVVVSVDYRRAPEHPFPAAIEDGVAAHRWVHEKSRILGIDPDRLAVAGDSAGATISTVVCQRGIVENNPVPDLQLLFYPITDYPGGYDSRKQFAEGFFLTESMMDWFSDHYLRGVDADTETDPRLSPIRFDDLGGMPPSMVVTAGFDPLRDEGEAYAQKMRERGVRVVHRSYDRFVHGFMNMGGVVDDAARAIADLAERFRQELRR